MEEETWSRRGWRVGGGGRCILKTVIAKEWGGGTIFICNYFVGGKVLIHHTFLKTPAPLWDVINDPSLTLKITLYQFSAPNVNFAILVFNS